MFEWSWRIAAAKGAILSRKYLNENHKEGLEEQCLRERPVYEERYFKNIAEQKGSTHFDGEATDWLPPPDEQVLEDESNNWKDSNPFLEI